MLLRLAPGGDLLFDLPAALHLQPAVYRRLTGEQPHAGQGDEKQNVLGQGGGRHKREGVEDLGEDRAEDRDQGDLPAGKDGPDEEHGEDVEEAEVDVDRVPPIDEDYDRNEHGGAGKHGAGSPSAGNARAVSWALRLRESPPCVVPGRQSCKVSSSSHALSIKEYSAKTSIFGVLFRTK